MPIVMPGVVGTLSCTHAGRLSPTFPASHTEGATVSWTTIPDERTGPPISGDPVTAEDADASFRLTLAADQGRYRAGQEIGVVATLTYLGPADEIVARGSSNPGLAVETDDPPIRISPAYTTDCGPHEMTRGVVVEYQLAKSGGYSPDEPLAPFYEAYFGSQELRLPAGTWTSRREAGGTPEAIAVMSSTR